MAAAHRAGEPEPATELKLKEQVLRDREKILKEREERLEQREQELCARERRTDEKLVRAESLRKNYNLLRQPKDLAGLHSKDRDRDEDCSPGKGKIHFARDSKENHRPVSRDSMSSQELILKKRLQAANSRAQAWGRCQKAYPKSRQLQDFHFKVDHLPGKEHTMPMPCHTGMHAWAGPPSTRGFIKL